MVNSSPTHPGDPQNVDAYWGIGGPGGMKIRWGEPGDLDRCVLHLGKYFPDADARCAALQTKQLPPNTPQMGTGVGGDPSSGGPYGR